MKNKKYLFLSLALLILIIAILFSYNHASGVDYKNILGNIASIDMSSLKSWQQNSGFNKNLTFGSKNNDVKLVQKALSTDSKIYPEKIFSGYFGKYTRSALISFQKENNIPVTGFFDEITRLKMNEIFYNELCPIQVKEYPDYINFIFSKTNKLPDDFIPRDLQNVQYFNVRSAGGIICLRSDALESLKNMFDGAKKEGVLLAVTSGFRKSSIQQWLVNYYFNIRGEEALKSIALPGYSEHQLGTTVDLTGSSINYKSTQSNFGNTVEGNWLNNNAYKYGFFMSYPLGNSEYIFEPWHYRFLGLDK